MRIAGILLILSFGLAACDTLGIGRTRDRPHDDGPYGRDGYRAPYVLPGSWRLSFDESNGQAAEPGERQPRFYRTLKEAFPSDGKWWKLGYRSVGRATLDIPKADTDLADPREVLAHAFRNRGADVVVILSERDVRAPMPGGGGEETDVKRIVAEGFIQDPGAPEVSARQILQTATQAAKDGDWPQVGNLLNPGRVRELGVVDEVRPSSVVPLAIRADYEPLCVSFAKLGFRSLSPRQLIILFRASRRDLPAPIRTQLQKSGGASIADAAKLAGSRRCAAVFERVRFMGEPRG
ncbi:MAG: hypothetical protein ACLFV8_04210 [Alphaproteobacteria bacterium]